ncbi:unnamed protein product [Effrenium voratum]|nr:unnamed protein product [Effrenium voratum]
MVSGDGLLTFGKHAGRTFSQILREEKKYAQWAVKELCESHIPNARAFASYCMEKGIGGALQNMSQEFQLVAVPGPSQEEPEHACEKCGSSCLESWMVRCHPCFKEHCVRLDTDFYLRCPFEEKDEAKARGGIKFDWDAKKWYVPAGLNISLWERWHVCCENCHESISNDDAVTAMERQRKPVTCPGGECAPELRARIEKERLERETEERSKNKAKFLERQKEEFWRFLKKSCKSIEQAMQAKNEEAQEKLEAAGPPSGSPAKRRRTSGRRKEFIFMPFPNFVQGSLLAHLKSERGQVTYNPFQEDELESMQPKAARWIQSIGTNRFKKKSSQFVLALEYTPEQLLSFGATFHASSLFDHWAVATGNIQKMEEFLTHSLQQTLDSATPDVVALVQQELRSRYGTHCPDVEGIFGSQIFPRCRADLGAQWEKMSREQKVLRGIFEYMEHRKVYDASTGETEQTTFMRDVMTQVIEAFQEKGPNVLDFEQDPAGSDRLYFNPAKPLTYVLLAHPNTKAVDLFSLKGLPAKQKGKSKGTSAASQPGPAHEDCCKRIFAAFRRMHWRIVREIRAGRFAVYGVDQGLRKADRDKRFLEFKAQHKGLHKELKRLSTTCPTALRDWVGFEGKKLHSNSELVPVVFENWLGLDKKLVARVRADAEKKVTGIAKNLSKTQAKLKKRLVKSGIKIRDLE